MNAPEHHHIPVLLAETLQALAPRPGGRYIDATLGGGGHTEAILEASSPDGRLLGLDADPRAIQRVAQRLAPFQSRITLVNSNFRHLTDIAQRHNFTAVDGILLDLGLSSFHLDEAEQGFSFRQEGPLDMRMNPGSGPSAADLVNTLDAEALADILYRYGEERRSRRIARAIIAHRPIHTTTQLADIVVAAIGRKPGGILAVITFHSLEDRIVKHYFRQESRDCICPPRQPVCTCGHRAQLKELRRKGFVPSPTETEQNPRSRSARLRAAQKLPPSSAMPAIKR